MTTTLTQFLSFAAGRAPSLEARWPHFADAARCEIDAYLAKTDFAGVRAFLLTFDHEGDRQSVLLDADASRHPFSDGLVSPQRVLHCADLLAGAPDDGQVVECAVCLCAELLATRADVIATKAVPQWVIAVQPGHDETPRVVFEGDASAKSIFDDSGHFALKSVEEEIECVPSDGRAVAALYPRVQSAGDSMNLLEKVDGVFYDIATSGTADERREEVTALLKALAKDVERLSLWSWHETFEKVLGKAVACVVSDEPGLRIIVDKLLPPELTVPGLPFNIACAFARLGRKPEALEWVERTLEMGYDKEKLLGESDLESLHEDPGFQKLLDATEVSLETLNRELHEAIEELDLDAVRKHVAAGADVNSKVDHDWILYTAIKATAWGGEKKKLRREIVEHLMDSGAMLSESDWPCFAMVRDIELLNLLLDRGAPLSSKLVLQTVESEELPTLKALVERGVKLAEHEPAKLLGACRNLKKTEILSYLLSQGLDPNSANSLGQTLALESASGGNIAVLDAILAAGGNLHARDKRGRIVLSYAFGNDRVDFLEHAASLGADLKSVDNDGRGLVHQAVADRAVKCFMALVRLGAPIDLPDAKGQTALHCAARRDIAGAVNELLKNGANREARDLAGQRPIDLAEGETVRELLAASA